MNSTVVLAKTSGSDKDRKKLNADNKSSKTNSIGALLRNAETEKAKTSGAAPAAPTSHTLTDNRILIKPADLKNIRFEGFGTPVKGVDIIIAIVNGQGEARYISSDTKYINKTSQTVLSYAEALVEELLPTNPTTKPAAVAVEKDIVPESASDEAANLKLVRTFKIALTGKDVLEKDPVNQWLSDSKNLNSLLDLQLALKKKGVPKGFEECSDFLMHQINLYIAELKTNLTERYDGKKVTHDKNVYVVIRDKLGKLFQVIGEARDGNRDLTDEEVTEIVPFMNQSLFLTVKQVMDPDMLKLVSPMYYNGEQLKRYAGMIKAFFEAKLLVETDKVPLPIPFDLKGTVDKDLALGQLAIKNKKDVTIKKIAALLCSGVLIASDGIVKCNDFLFDASAHGSYADMNTEAWKEVEFTGKDKVGAFGLIDYSASILQADPSLLDVRVGIDVKIKDNGPRINPKSTTKKPVGKTKDSALEIIRKMKSSGSSTSVHDMSSVDTALRILKGKFSTDLLENARKEISAAIEKVEPGVFRTAFVEKIANQIGLKMPLF